VYRYLYYLIREQVVMAIGDVFDGVLDEVARCINELLYTKYVLI
jgi:hypothetical protein